MKSSQYSSQCKRGFFSFNNSFWGGFWLSFGALIVLALPASLFSKWPTFRGNFLRNGYLPITTEFPLQRVIPKTFVAEPLFNEAIVNDRVAIINAQDGRRHYFYDLQTKRMVFQQGQLYPTHIAQSFGQFGSASLDENIHETQIYITLGQTLLATDAAGKTLWSFQLIDVDNNNDRKNSFIGDAIVLPDVIVIADYSTLYFLDRLNGELLTQFHTGSVLLPNLAVHKNSDGSWQLYFFTAAPQENPKNNDSRLFNVSLQSLTVKNSLKSTATTAQQNFKNGRKILQTWPGQKELRFHLMISPDLQRYFVVQKNSLYAYSLPDQQELWFYESGLEVSLPAADDEAVYFSDLQSSHLLKLQQSSGKLLWKKLLEHQPTKLLAPVVTKDAVIFGSDKNILFINKQNAQTKYRLDLEGKLLANFSITDRSLFVYSEDANLDAFLFEYRFKGK